MVGFGWFWLAMLATENQPGQLIFGLDVHGTESCGSRGKMEAKDQEAEVRSTPVYVHCIINKLFALFSDPDGGSDPLSDRPQAPP